MPTDVNEATLQAVMQTNKLTREQALQAFSTAQEQKISLAAALQQSANRSTGQQSTQAALNAPIDPATITTPVNTIDTTPPPVAVGGSVASASASASGLSVFQQSILQELTKVQEQRQAAEQKNQGLLAKLTQKNTVDTAEVRQNVFQELGLPEGFTGDTLRQITGIVGEIDSLNQRLIASEQLEQQRLLAAEQQQGIPRDIISNEKVEISREAAITQAAISASIQAKAATAQMLRGNVQMAEDLVSQAIDLELFDIQQQRQDMEFIFSNYQDEISVLSRREQQLLDIARDDLLREEEQARADLEQKTSLYLDSGVPIPDVHKLRGMSLQDVVADVQKRKVAGGKVLSVTEAKALGVPFGTTEKEAYGITPAPSKTLAEQLSEILTPAEAEKFGVPFGTTKDEVVGLSPLGVTQREAASAFISAKEIIKSIGFLSDKLITADSFPGNLTQGALLQGGALTKQNTDAALFASKKEGLISLLVRALGEKGVLTTQDVNRVRSLLPSFFDTKDIATTKIADLEEFINNVEKNTLQSFTTPVEEGQFKGQENSDPLGILE